MQAVAIFLPSGVLAGAEQLLVQIAREYHRREFEVHFFLLTSIKAEEIAQILPESKIHICKSGRELTGLFLLFFKVLFNSTRFEYVYSSHVHLNGFVAFMRRIGFLHAKHHIGRESTNIFSRFKKGRRRLMFDIAYNYGGYKNIDFIICQTESMRRELDENKPFINTNKMTVFQNPVTINENWSDLQNPFPGKHYIVAAGRLIIDKGFDLLLDCMPAILIEFPDIELVILGEGTERSNLELKRDKLSLNKQVHFLGWQENVYPYFKYAKACIVSSRHEGFPNVLLQMMMCNNTVVSTQCADSIASIKGIYSCPANDTQSLTEEISLALKTDNTEKRKMFDEFLAENTIDKYVRKIEEFLNK